MRLAFTDIFSINVVEGSELGIFTRSVNPPTISCRLTWLLQEMFKCELDMDNHEEDYEMLGERLYSLIYPKHKDNAGKLTGE